MKKNVVFAQISVYQLACVVHLSDVQRQVPVELPGPRLAEVGHVVKSWGGCPTALLRSEELHQQNVGSKRRCRVGVRVDTRCEALWGKHSHLHVSDLWVKSITPYKKPLTLLLSVLYEVKKLKYGKKQGELVMGQNFSISLVKKF